MQLRRSILLSFAVAATLGLGVVALDVPAATSSVTSQPTVAAVYGQASEPNPEATVPPSCYGSTCEGKRAHGEACDRDARTVAELTDDYTGITLRVQLKYSTYCGAFWATGSADNHAGSGSFGINEYSCSAANDACRTNVHDRFFSYPGYANTKMYGWAHWVRACWYEGPGAEAEACTAAYT